MSFRAYLESSRHAVDKPKSKLYCVLQVAFKEENLKELIKEARVDYYSRWNEKG